MSTNNESLKDFVEGQMDPFGKAPDILKPSSEHRLSDAIETLKDSIIGDACRKTGEALNYPNDEKMMEEKRKMSDAKEM